MVNDVAADETVGAGHDLWLYIRYSTVKWVAWGSIRRGNLAGGRVHRTPLWFLGLLMASAGVRCLKFRAIEKRRKQSHFLIDEEGGSVARIISMHVSTLYRNERISNHHSEMFAGRCQFYPVCLAASWKMRLISKE